MFVLFNNSFVFLLKVIEGKVSVVLSVFMLPYLFPSYNPHVFVSLCRRD